MTEPRPERFPAITGWGCALPKHTVTNDDLAQRIDTSDEWIFERTGIHERRIVDDTESTATLAVDTARSTIARARISPNEIGLLIIATCTPEQTMPHTGAFVGEALGLSCGSFDLNTACSGFVYALMVADAMTRTGIAHVLIIGSDTMSRIVDPEDRATAILFGDGAGATIVDANASPILSFLGSDLGCDGSAASILGVLAGGSKLPTSQKTLDDGDHFMHMHGQEVFKRAVHAVVTSCDNAMRNANLKSSDIEWFVPHQANVRIVEAAATRLGISMDNTVVNLERYGNTSSASIPLALFEAVDDGRIQPGELVLVCGFGAGLTWATSLIRWPANESDSL